MWTDKPGSVTRVDKHAERELHGMKELESEDDDFIDVEKVRTTIVMVTIATIYKLLITFYRIVGS
jgi:hypothetical protein